MQTSAKINLEEGTDIGSEDELRRTGMLLAKVRNHNIVVFFFEGKTFAVDNRCPHMGYPLSKGSVRDGILTCHWHHARFDLETGGTFDLFADDVETYKTELANGRVYVFVPIDSSDNDAISARSAHVERKLREGMEHSLNLVLAKAVLQELAINQDTGTLRILDIASDFGTTFRLQGWGPGLTILTCMSNILDYMNKDDRVAALVQGLAHVSLDCFEEPARHSLSPLSPEETNSNMQDYASAKKWFRNFVDQREPEASERTLQSAVRLFTKEDVASMVFLAATDHIFLNGGHVYDFANKAFEMVDKIGWQEGGAMILPSIVRQMCLAQRHEEDADWRNPDDLVSLVREAESRIPNTISSERKNHGEVKGKQIAELALQLLSDKPQPIISSIENAVSSGKMNIKAIACSLTTAAAIRLARFHTQNEFGDWITVLHSFSYCNAVLQSTRLLSDGETTLRAIYHGAMNLYLTRFLNVPSASLPTITDGLQTSPRSADTLLEELLVAMDRKDVEGSARLVSQYLQSKQDMRRLISILIHCVVREDSEFHTFQLIEATIKTIESLQEICGSEDESVTELERLILIGATRYIAAHSPTDRSLPQTISIAQRLQRGEALYGSE